MKSDLIPHVKFWKTDSPGGWGSGASPGGPGRPTSGPPFPSKIENPPGQTPRQTAVGFGWPRSCLETTQWLGVCDSSVGVLLLSRVPFHLNGTHRHVLSTADFARARRSLQSGHFSSHPPLALALPSPTLPAMPRRLACPKARGPSPPSHRASGTWHRIPPPHDVAPALVNPFSSNKPPHPLPPSPQTSSRIDERDVNRRVGAISPAPAPSSFTTISS